MSVLEFGSDINYGGGGVTEETTPTLFMALMFYAPFLFSICDFYYSL